MRMRGLFVCVDQEYGLVFVSNETVEEDGNDRKKKNRRRRKKEEQEKDTAALVTPDALTVLGKVQGNLGTLCCSPLLSSISKQHALILVYSYHELSLLTVFVVHVHCADVLLFRACADERLKQFADGQQKLEDEIKKLRVELDEERAKNVLAEKYSPKSSAAHKDGLNGPTSDGLSYEANSKSRGLGQGFGFDVSVHMF